MKRDGNRGAPNSERGLRCACAGSLWPERNCGLGESAGAGVAERPACPASAFTLIELVISASLMALILASGYLCFDAAISAQKLVEPRAEIIQSGRVAMALMAADLRAACPLSPDYDFLGMPRMLGQTQADNLDFGTHNFTPRRVGEGDFCQTSYFLDKNPETGQLSLWRRRNPRLALDPLSGGSREEIAPGVLGLKFEYYDGIEWYESWGDTEGRGKAQSSRRERTNLAGLPDAVRITLWLDSNPRARQREPAEEASHEPPLVFQTVARLNLAANARRSASSNSSATAGDSSGQSAPGATSQGRNP